MISHSGPSYVRLIHSILKLADGRSDDDGNTSSPIFVPFVVCLSLPRMMLIITFHRSLPLVAVAYYGSLYLYILWNCFIAQFQNEGDDE